MSELDDDWTVIHREEITWWENSMAWVGYVICEIAYRSPNWCWSYLFYPSWCHSLGGWFYGLAFDRWSREHHNEGWK